MSDRRYFVSVPNIVFDITLSENARRLYMRIKRDAGDAGALCNETLSKLARDAHMGKAQAIEARDELATPHPELDGLPLIRVRQRGRVGNATTHSIELVDLWPLNMARYAPKTLAVPAAEPVLNGTASRSQIEPAGSEWNREPVLNGTAYEELNPEELNHCDAATAAVAAPSPMQTTQSAHAVDVATPPSTQAGSSWLPLASSMAGDLEGRSSAARTKAGTITAFYGQLVGMFGAKCNDDPATAADAWRRFVAAMKSQRMKDGRPVWSIIRKSNVLEQAGRWLADDNGQAEGLRPGYAIDPETGRLYVADWSLIP